jgi:hypothetical protein
VGEDKGYLRRACSFCHRQALEKELGTHKYYLRKAKERVLELTERLNSGGSGGGSSQAMLLQQTLMERDNELSALRALLQENQLVRSSWRPLDSVNVGSRRCAYYDTNTLTSQMAGLPPSLLFAVPLCTIPSQPYLDTMPTFGSAGGM